LLRLRCFLLLGSAAVNGELAGGFADARFFFGGWRSPAAGLAGGAGGVLRLEADAGR
jgi:hypothetical protein